MSAVPAAALLAALALAALLAESLWAVCGITLVDVPSRTSCPAASSELTSSVTVLTSAEGLPGTNSEIPLARRGVPYAADASRVPPVLSE